MDKIGRMQKTDLKIFFLLQQFEVAIRVHVQPNFPIVILSLFTGLYKCLMSMALKHLGTCTIKVFFIK